MHVVNSASAADLIHQWCNVTAGTTMAGTGSPQSCSIDLSSYEVWWLQCCSLLIVLRACCMIYRRWTRHWRGYSLKTLGLSWGYRHLETRTLCLESLPCALVVAESGGGEWNVTRMTFSLSIKIRFSRQLVWLHAHVRGTVNVARRLPSQH